MSDRHYRSVVKGASWRAIGTLDTIFLSWLFTGQIAAALKIGGIEVVTKIFLFYVHERAWLRLDFARKNVDLGGGAFIKKDRHHRSIIKAVSWRLLGTLDTILIALLITGDYSKAFAIGFTEVITKIFLYYLHERTWHRIKFGRRPPDPGQG